METVAINIKMPRAMRDELKVICARERTTFQAMVTRYLDEVLKSVKRGDRGGKEGKRDR